jgi:uncharacterized membrane-anchored protein
MRWKLAVAWVGIQVLFFAGWAATEQRRLATGSSILVRTAPVDPRDLLRGQYLGLSYEFSRMQPFTDSRVTPQEGEEVWVVLAPAGEYHVPRGYFPYRPQNLNPGEIPLVGRAERWRFLFGIEEYYVPEGSGTPAQQDTTVRLRVGHDGKPRIEKVLVRGKPWP